jgi:hypothetical protein
LIRIERSVLLVGVMTMATLSTIGVTAACTKALPGETGPRLAELAGPLPQHGISAIAVAGLPYPNTTATQADTALAISKLFDPSSQSWPQTLPAGTKQIYVLVTFVREPANGTKLRTTLVAEGGAIDTPMPQTVISLSRPSGERLEAMLVAAATDRLRAGPYQCVVSVNDKDVARLNWTIGAQ